MKDRGHCQSMAELPKDAPAFAAEYLNQILQDDGPAENVLADLGFEDAAELSAKAFVQHAALIAPASGWLPDASRFRLSDSRTWPFFSARFES